VRCHKNRRRFPRKEGVTYYEVPQEYDVPVYKYAIVNGRTVLVDPRSHRIMQIID
jgi:hypothetical protein